MAVQLGPGVLKIANRGLLSLFADSVKVIIHLWILLVKLNNFTFDNKAVLCLESTILDGRPAGRPAGRPGEAGNITTSAPS